MKEHWHRSVRRLLLILALCGVLLIAAEVGLVGDSATAITAFYAGAGFLSCLVLVVLALLIGKIIKRREDYYER